MTTAIVGAYQVDVTGTPVALLPLAGMQLAEHQARRAAACGAHRVFLLVDAPSAALADLVGKLRHDDIAASMIDSLATAADQIGLEEAVLVIADGCLAEPALLEAVTSGPAPIVAVVADLPAHARYERIDATTRWAGIALIEGATLAETAAMLGAWDPVSTLLRRVLQQDAPRIEAGQPPLLAQGAQDLVGAERAMLVTSRAGQADWITHYLFNPIGDRALPVLLVRGTEARALMAASAGLALLAGMTALPGLRWPALVALLVVGPVAAAGERLARMQGRDVAGSRNFSWARRIGRAVAAAGLGWSLTTASGQWGWLLVAAVLITALTALAGERAGYVPRWYANPRTLPWELLPFALASQWEAGLAVLTLHACASFAGALAARRRDQRASTPT